ncbi:unnamed protein product [Peronospora destructor]|uniref:t-SNARE coiled-coil homology domain-containing protein n=1 Tax=Peronospora destructor TaxID=86335 RepID=A0AAV0UG68_9STRA|nr:unnamed protein product [Peronospora destructor]
MAAQNESASRLEWQQRHTQALQHTAESLQIGRAAAHTLSMQTEQLGRSERLLDETQATVDMSKRVLRGMSWSGWLYNKFSTSSHFSTNRKSDEIAMGFICPECKVIFKSSEQLGTHYSNSHEKKEETSTNIDARWTEARELQEQSQITGNSVEDIHDTFFQHLEPQLAEMKEQSLAFGNTLDMQNQQLDRLDSKIGRVHHDMKKVGILVNKIAGKKMPVEFRFRCAFQEVQTGRFLQDVDGEALLDADVVVAGCTFRAYTLGDDSDVWGFQSEKSSYFLGINRYGNLKVRGADLNSYEQFLVESKASTPIFSLSSFFGFGGWIARKGSVVDNNLTIIRGSPENKSSAAYFKIVNLEEDGIQETRKK